MVRKNLLSSRKQALESILHVRSDSEAPSIDETGWGRIVDLAWDARTQDEDRRGTQRELREVLLAAARERVSNAAE